jgi:hypothetical protein
MGKRQRVFTGCADCHKCTTSRAAVGVRNTGRVGAAVATVGLSEAAMALSRTCNTCGHQMSLHDRPGAQSLAGRAMSAVFDPAPNADGRPFPPSFYEGQAAPAQQAAPPVTGGPAAGWYSDPDGTPNLRWWNGQSWTDHRQ